MPMDQVFVALAAFVNFNLWVWDAKISSSGQSRAEFDFIENMIRVQRTSYPKIGKTNQLIQIKSLVFKSDKISSVE